MGIFVGDNPPTEIYVGDNPVSEVYVGDTMVWPVSRVIYTMPDYANEAAMLVDWTEEGANGTMAWIGGNSSIRLNWNANLVTVSAILDNPTYQWVCTPETVVTIILRQGSVPQGFLVVREVADVNNNVTSANWSATLNILQSFTLDTTSLVGLLVEFDVSALANQFDSIDFNGITVTANPAP
jgi:hypothetical protein